METNNNTNNKNTVESLGLIEVTLPNNDAFLQVRETLSRMGIPSKREKTLYQTCHILHKRGKYYIVHFKELFALDGKGTNISEEDIARRNTIANLLAEWELVVLVNPAKTKSPLLPVSQVKILPYKEKNQWKLVTKYSIGKHKSSKYVADNSMDVTTNHVGVDDNSEQ